MAMNRTEMGLTADIDDLPSEPEGSEGDFLPIGEEVNILSLYSKDLWGGEKPRLLTSSEEAEYTTSYAAGRRAQTRLGRQGARLKPGEKEGLEEKVMVGKEAAKKLIRANNGLVIKIASGYVGRGLPFPDLIQEGGLGVLRAAERFEPARGYKFSTYATWWIRQGLQRAVHEQGRTIRIPVHAGDSRSKVDRFEKRFLPREGRKPTVAEIAQGTGLSEEKVTKTLAITDMLSLEMPVGDGQSTLGDFVEDESARSVDEETFLGLLREELWQAISKLSPRLQNILILRFGLEDGQPLTLEEIGQRFGVSRERIRQQEAQALKVLRHPRNSRKLRAHLPKRFKI